MKVQSFLGKATIEALHQMDEHINAWLKRNNVTPLHIKQSFGSEKFHDGRSQDPIVIITVWYEGGEEERNFDI